MAAQRLGPGDDSPSDDPSGDGPSGRSPSRGGPRRRSPSGLRSQVKPTFMVPAVGMSLFGGLLAPAFAPLPGLVHAAAVGAALYVAHLVDEYVDAHLRGEEPPALPAPTARRVAVASGLACLALLAWLWLGGHRAAAATGLPLLALAVLHAPVLDRHPVAVTVDYPVGIGLAVLGGHAAQRGAVPVAVLAIAAVFVVVLAAVKVSVDRADHGFDRRIGKRTVPVVLGPRRARHASAALLVCAGGLLCGLSLLAVLPPAALLSVPVVLAMAAAAFDASPARAARRQVALAYPVAAVLFGTWCLAAGCALGRHLPWLSPP